MFVTNLKALIIVLTAAITVFIIAKPICLRFIAEADFARRRNVWFVLTLTAFMSPSFWLFVLVAIPLLAWCAHKDTNAVALYVLLFNVISPNTFFDIPVVGIDRLFELNIYRILSFAILIPAAWRLTRSTGKSGFGGLAWMDALILAYVALQLVLFMPYESITHSMRRGFLLSIDVLVLYFVVSRTCTSRRAIVETMASFCLACAIMAPLALFESLKGWLLYWEIDAQWGILWRNVQYTFRAGTLRAQVSAGHPITLGYMLAIAFGFWLYLRSRVQSTPITVAVALWMCVGLLAAYSRAPWLVAVMVFVAYLALGPNGSARLFKASLIAALFAGIVLVSPIGERVIDNLPYVGTVDAETVTYRQRLAARSWELIQKNPFFGSAFFLTEMEDLRQGQGIIDLMNAYAGIALSSGLVGLSLLLAPFLIGMGQAYRLTRRSASVDADLSLLGATLTACMLGTLLMMATGVLGGGLAQMFYVLAGLAAGYAWIGSLGETASGPAVSSKQNSLSRQPLMRSPHD